MRWKLDVRAADTVSLRRKIVASAAGASAAAVVAGAAFRPYGVNEVIFASSVVVALASLGISRRSLVAQVLSRGAFFLVLAPSLVITLSSAWHGHFAPWLAVLAAASGTALLVSRPLLHTKEARAAFAPNAYRRWLLGGSIALCAAGYLSAAIGLEASAAGVAAGALSASYFASAIAVVRMRAWGVLLGTATSIVLLLSAFVVPWLAVVGPLFAAAPALLGHLLPVLLARHRGAPAREEPVRYRVASSLPPVAELEEVEAEEDARAAARA